MLTLSLNPYPNPPGSRAHRMKCLGEFVNSHTHATSSDLEAHHGNGASLFFSRVLAWFRLTYMHGVSISLLLQTITIFINASSGNDYLDEFLEVSHATYDSVGLVV